MNRPLNAPVATNNQDGKLNHGHRTGDVNYEPSTSTGGRRDNPAFEQSKAKLTGTVVQQPIEKQLNFKQAGELYESFSEEMKTNLDRQPRRGHEKDSGQRYQGDVGFLLLPRERRLRHASGQGHQHRPRSGEAGRSSKDEAEAFGDQQGQASDAAKDKPWVRLSVRK